MRYYSGQTPHAWIGSSLQRDCLNPNRLADANRRDAIGSKLNCVFYQLATVIIKTRFDPDLSVRDMSL
jgi:hypothetical protein